MSKLPKKLRLIGYNIDTPLHLEQLLDVAADRIEELERLLKEEKEKAARPSAKSNHMSAHCERTDWDNFDDGDPWNE